MIKNKKGWLKIVEAFVAVLLIMMVALIIIGQQQGYEQDVSEKVYDIEADIMEEILINNMNLVTEDDFQKLNEVVDSKTPNYLQCLSIVCEINEPCEVERLVGDAGKDKDIYVQVMPIIKQEGKQLKIACWI